MTCYLLTTQPSTFANDGSRKLGRHGQNRKRQGPQGGRAAGGLLPSPKLSCLLMMRGEQSTGGDAAGRRSRKRCSTQQPGRCDSAACAAACRQPKAISDLMVMHHKIFREPWMPSAIKICPAGGTWRTCTESPG